MKRLFKKQVNKKHDPKKIAILTVIVFILLALVTSYLLFFKKDPVDLQQTEQTAFEKSYSEGGYQASIDYIKSQINKAQNKDKYELYIQLSSYYSAAGMRDESIQAMQSAYEISGTKNPVVGVVLGAHYESDNEKSKALAYYKEAATSLRSFSEYDPRADSLKQLEEKIKVLEK